MLKNSYQIALTFAFILTTLGSVRNQFVSDEKQQVEFKTEKKLDDTDDDVFYNLPPNPKPTLQISGISLCEISPFAKTTKSKLYIRY